MTSSVISWLGVTKGRFLAESNLAAETTPSKQAHYPPPMSFTAHTTRHALLQPSKLGKVFHSREKQSSRVHAKKDIHPKYYEEAKVICKGEEVMTTSGTMEEYTVDVWSGNHPFYTNSETNMVTDEGRVSRFNKRFGDGLAMGKVGSSKPGEKRLEYKSPSKKGVVKGKGGKKK